MLIERHTYVLMFVNTMDVMAARSAVVAVEHRVAGLASEPARHVVPSKANCCIEPMERC